jgi:hypothetical protein
VSRARIHASGLALAATLAGAAIALVGLGASGCGEGDPGSPVPPAPLPEDDAGPPPPADAGTDASPEPKPVKRTIAQRNPFGNVAEAENLLWDGDFEWSSPFASQYGWLTGSVSSLAYDFEGGLVGAACRSGIKCVAVPDHRVLVGVGVSSKGHKLEASFWVRVTTGSCAGVEAQLVALFGFDDPDAPLAPDAEAPDASGWCRYGAVVEERLEKTFLFIRNDTGAEIIVDDAVLKKAPETSAIHVVSRAPAPEEAAEIEALRASLRARRGPQDMPPSAARRAAESWGARRSSPGHAPPEGRWREP